MFNTQHILYMVISGALTVLFLALAGRYVKDDRRKRQILKFFAIITVIIHYSDLWVDYFSSGGTAQVGASQLMPVYPCNVVMWMLLAASLMKDQKRLVFQMLGEFCFIGGFICSVVGIVFNFNFDSTPTLADYTVLKGLLSHSTMLLGCLYLRTGGFIRIRMFNIVSVIAGLAIFVTCGVAVNRLFDCFGMEAPDGMMLRENPYIPVPTALLGIGVVILLFCCLSLWELRLPKEQRWYRKIRKRK